MHLKKGKTLMRHVITISLGLLLIERLSADPELKGSPMELAAYLAGLPETVSVAGESEVKLSADRALISLRVSTEHRSLQDALRANQEVRNKILNSLRDCDIPGERIQTSKFSSTPKYGMFSDKAKSYRVENIVKVIVRDEKEFQAVAHLVDAFAEVQYLGIEFEHSEKEALKMKALAQALDDASARKKVYEERLGVKLTPKGFSRSAVAQNLPQRQPAYQQEKSFAGSQSKLSAGLPSADLVPAATEEAVSPFGEIIFTGRVVVEYRVVSN
jgi:uncharacterized protein